jgi:parallel beta-helix repeat protein
MGTDYQVQVSADEEFAQIVWDSGKEQLTESPASGERCEDIECGVELSDETEYWWRIKFWDHHNLEGKWSETTWFKVGDLTPPEPPVMEEQPPEGAVVSSPTVYLSGWAEPGATVLVYGSPVLLASTVVGPDGLWSLDLLLPDGAYDLVIFVRDPAGNLSTPWTVSFLIDTTPPMTAAFPGGGTYSEPVAVELTSSDNLDLSPVIHWTLDGSDPDGGSPVYSEPIQIQASAALKFRAVDHAGNWEPVRTEQYDIIGNYIYVDDANGDDANDGTSRETAVKTIQKGLDLAGASGWTVLVAPGTYKGAGNKNLDFKGKAVHLKSVGGADTCIIDCEGDGRGFYFHTNETNAAVVEGFTICNGKVPETEVGGAVFCEKSSPTIRDCVMTGNAGTYGGAICIINADPRIYRCVMDNNSAVGTGYGGAIHAMLFDGILSECIITNNKGAVGGAMRIVYSEALIDRCRIENNTATGYGGGIFVNGTQTLKLTNCIFEGNRAQYGGGVFAQYYSQPLFANCTIVKNRAGTYGGGITSATASPTLNNTIIWGNTAPTGNELYARSSESTITLNYCDYGNGPNDVAGPGTVTTSNCITDDPQFVNAGEKNYRVHSASPCVDAGNNSLVPLDLTRDLDGDARIIDGDGDQIETVDIGAYEYEPLAAQVATESLMPNNTLAGKSKWFSVDLKNTGEWEIVLTPDTRLEVWDTGFFERKFSTSLAQQTVVKSQAVSQLHFDEAATPEDLLSGELALRVVAFTTRGYSHDLTVADRLTLVPDLVIVDASNSPYKVRGNCDFLDIWVKEGGRIIFEGASRQYVEARDVTTDDDFGVGQEAELIISGRNMTIGPKGVVNLVGKGYEFGWGPGPGADAKPFSCGAGGGASIAQDGENGENPHGDFGWGGKKHTRERMGSGGGWVVAPASSEGGGSIAIILDGTLTNNGAIDVSGNDGRVVLDLNCGTGGGGAVTIFIWADTVAGAGLFVALGGDGGGKGEVTHWGGDGGDGFVKICWVSQLDIDEESQIKIGEGKKEVIKRTTEQLLWEILPYIGIMMKPPRTLAEYEEDGKTLDSEKIIETIQPALSQEQLLILFQELNVELETYDKFGETLKCAKLEHESGIDHMLKAEPFLSVVLTADERVDFDASDFVGKAVVSVSFRGWHYGRQEYLVLTGKWPSPSEREYWKAERTGAQAHVGLKSYPKEWTIVTEDRINKVMKPDINYANFNCHAWAVGKTDKPESIFNLTDGKTVYGAYNYTEAEHPYENADIALMGYLTRATHSYRTVGFNYWTSKMGCSKQDPVFIHTKRAIDPPDDNPRAGSNCYGKALRWYYK